MFKVIVAGGRDFNNYEGLSNSLDYLFKKHQRRYPGSVRYGSRRRPAWRAICKKEHGYQVIYFPADWDLDGKSAGFKRNVKWRSTQTLWLRFGTAAPEEPNI